MAKMPGSVTGRRPAALPLRAAILLGATTFLAPAVAQVRAFAPPPPPPALSFRVPPVLVQPPSLQSSLPRVELTPPCLNCTRELPRPPEVRPSPQDDQVQETTATRHAHVQRLWKELEQHMGNKRWEPALGVLDSVAAITAQDAALEPVLAQARTTREQVLLAWAGSLLDAGQHDQALAVLRRAAPSADRDGAIAGALFATGRHADAFAALRQLEAADATRATRLRGSFYLQLGALPLAVEQFERVGDAPDVASLLRGLEQKALRRFRRGEQAGWFVYEAQGPHLASRTVAYWLAAEAGEPDPERVAELSVRPAPRKLTLGLILRNLLRLRWPAGEQAQEYELAVYREGRRDVVALWDREPQPEEIADAAALGMQAREPLARAEKLMHAGGAGEALRIALEQGGRRGWWFPPQPHYGALVLAVQAAVEAGDLPGAARIAGDIGDWHPMWGPLVLASALQQAGRAEEARAAHEAAIAAAPLRGEGYAKLAEFEWAGAQADATEQRPEAFLRAQRAARRLQAVRAAEGLWLRVRIALQLEALAPASAWLRQLALGADVPDAALEERMLLEALGQSEFARSGESLPLARGLSLQAYRARQGAPADPGLKHHAAEVVVQNAEGDIVETFALTSQRMVPGSPREYVLDRINAYGPQQLGVYGTRPPSLDRLLQGLAAL